MARKLNLAAAMGGWSARHRLAAIGGWLVLVIVTMVIDSMAGQVTMTKAEYGLGESGRAMWLLTNSGIAQPAQELVLVHGSTTATLTPAVHAVVSGIEATGTVQDVRPPATAASGHDVLIQFAIKGDPNTAQDRVQPVLAAVSAVRAAHPGVRIDEFGDATANKYFNGTIMKDFKRAEWTVVKAPDIQAPVAKREIAALAGWRGPAIGQPILVSTYPAADIAEIQVPLAGSGIDATSQHALSTLHDAIVPATVGKIPGAQALVGGNLAASNDWNNQLAQRMIPVFVFVMGITFLLMLAAFGSVVIAATTIALNLLSVGAAYGALVAVFQHGWGAALLGTTASGAIESWIPLFVFVVLFGLSMDYNVFVVSRIKEGHDHGLPTKEAVSHGIRATAGVVTSAAVIMVAVFAVFGTLSLQQFKQLAVGLAVSVLLDATVVRGVLLPTVMTLLGDRNWYRPNWHLGGGRYGH